MKLGIQLYSVLDEFKRNERRTLAALAGMGYQGVEFAFSFGQRPLDNLAADLRRLHLCPISFYSAYPLAALLDPDHEMYVRAKALQMKYITLGSGEFVRRDWPGTVKMVAEIARLARARGLTLNYHNHAEEFEGVGDKNALMLLAEQTDPELVKIELDTYFALKAGKNPLEYMQRFAGRMPLLHLKDINRSDGSVVEVGKGGLPLPAVLEAAGKTGVEWIIVEFHDIAGRPPLESARCCVANLNATGGYP